MMVSKYAMPRWIFIDVDGTLIKKDETLNQYLIDWCRKMKTEDYNLVLWSSRGMEHAKHAAETAGMLDVFDHIISKPGMIVDDTEWAWINFVPALDVWRD